MRGCYCLLAGILTAFSVTHAAQRPPRALHVAVVPLSSTATSCPAIAPASDLRFVVDGQSLVMPEWLASPSEFAFLTIDENENGLVDGATELVSNRMGPGNSLDVLVSRAIVNGIPSQGAIDAGHPLYVRLRLWQDDNRNGRSEPTELRPVSDFLAVVGLGTQMIGAGPCRFKNWSIRRADWSGVPRPNDRYHPIYDVALRLALY